MTLINKYRPTRWEDVIGHSSVIKSFARNIKTKGSQCYLLTGITGIGKTTLARIAAAELQATVLEIDAASNTGIDDMRAITDDLPYVPLDGHDRAIIVDECHALSPQAWKALLKSLEEPPSWIYWFLCTTEPTKVPANIKSRAAHYDLKPVGQRELTEWLADISEEEKLAGIGGIGVVDVCVKEANGSPRQALANLSVCATAKSRAEAAELLLSAEESEDTRALCQALLYNKGWRDVQRILAALKEQGTDAESIRRIVCAYMNTVIISSENKEKLVGRAGEILDIFGREPFYASVGISMVTRACVILCLG